MRRRADYRYDLPPRLIAQSPAARRADSRLLHASRGGPLHKQFADLVDLLPAGAVVVANDAKVRRARIRACKRDSGGAVELLLIEPTSATNEWRALARASKPMRAGQVLMTQSESEIEVVSARAPDGSIVVRLPESADALCQRDGELPLPPYIERESGPLASDAERYQTVYAKHLGAIAAPTAGLHFSEELIAKIRARGIRWETLTLDVGLGTFAPVRADSIDDHTLHAERYAVSAQTAEAVSGGAPVVAIGTSVVRALESAVLAGNGQVRAGEGVTNLFITPGFSFGVVTHLVTNFHLPESSLLMLVCAFAGYQLTMTSYREAVKNDYRFFSYGDAMLLERPDSAELLQAGTPAMPVKEDHND